MKNFKYTTTLVAALMLTGVTGIATAQKSETAGQYVDDTVITTKVKAAIVKDKTLKSAEINVETAQGVVQLSGFVAKPEAIPTATAVAGKVAGVKSVKNDIQVK